MSKPLDYSGEKFGRLLVLERVESNKHGQAMWKCLCDCGNEIVTCVNNLTQGDTKSCGCLHSEQAPKNARRRTDAEVVEACFRSLFLSYANRARKEDKAFDITEEDFREMTKMPCRFCGEVEVSFWKDYREDLGYRYNGIDRIDSSLGYEYGNVQPCCVVCNKMKINLDEDFFLAHIRKIIANS